LTETTALQAVKSPALFARKFAAKPELRNFVNRLTHQLWADENG